jgi:hypothetical protein
LEERKEKICLNCKAELQGRYCHVCGQENLEPKETAWHLISHFFKDITHFDGNFFSTVKYLFARPGFLSTEYMVGRRASYLNPVRLYIFTSAFFFLIFFNFFTSNRTNKEILEQNSTIHKRTLAEVSKMDSASFADFTRAINREEDKGDLPMTREAFKKYTDDKLQNAGFTIFGIRYRNRAAYDSALRTGEKKHNWLERQVYYKVIALSEKYNNNGPQMFGALRNSVLHSLPQLLFLSLPLLAWLLKMLYYRRRQYYYVNHAIFSIHLYIFIFIVLLFFFTVNVINTNYLHWGIFSYINFAFFLGIYFYVYKAMRKFYGQRRAKTITKFILLNLMFLVLMALLFVGFLLFSFFTI